MADPAEVVYTLYEQYTRGEFPSVSLPRYNRYVVTNFRGGIGKTSLTFNLAYELACQKAKPLLLDLCPQMNLSEVIMQDRLFSGVSVYEALLAEVMPGAATPPSSSISTSVGVTCSAFSGMDAYLVKGSNELYLFPGLLYTQLNAASSLMRTQASSAVHRLLFSLQRIVDREVEQRKTDKVLMDTSPFFAGATHLAWMAADALIVPVRVDHASIVGLELLLRMLHDPTMEFLRYASLAGVDRLPKIHSILITHANWSRRREFEPDAATRNFVSRAVDLALQYSGAFESDHPERHVFLLDDFLSAGKISGERGMPIGTLRAGQQFSIKGNKLIVNASVTRYQSQLKFISHLL